MIFLYIIGGYFLLSAFICTAVCNWGGKRDAVAPKPPSAVRLAVKSIPNQGGNCGRAAQR